MLSASTSIFKFSEDSEADSMMIAIRLARLMRLVFSFRFDNFPIPIFIFATPFYLAARGIPRAIYFYVAGLEVDPGVLHEKLHVYPFISRFHRSQIVIPQLFNNRVISLKFFQAQNDVNALLKELVKQSVEFNSP